MINPWDPGGDLNPEGYDKEKFEEWMNDQFTPTGNPSGDQWNYETVATYHPA